jgi:hypothetical protein
MTLTIRNAIITLTDSSRKKKVPKQIEKDKNEWFLGTFCEKMPLVDQFILHVLCIRQKINENHAMR